MSSILTVAQLAIPQQSSLPKFVPPPRFGLTSFENYQPQHLSQSEARNTVREFALSSRKRPPVFSWPWQRTRANVSSRGLYLDGGFGVGKTHLLAAAYHACDQDQKVYLSFQELVHVIGVLGMSKAKEELAGFELLCIDEFELDDPGNTLIVKTFLNHVFAQGGTVITTSNTLPEAQGQGRFNAEDFKREIQSLAANFTTLSIKGPDYRHRDHLAKFFGELELKQLEKTEVASGRKLRLTWAELLKLLNSYHPIRYGDILRQLDKVYLYDVQTILDQGNALRFVHFIDKLYDLKVGLRASGDITLEDIFDPSYRQSAYTKKHYRCLSRLSELFEENLPTGFYSVVSRR